ncbi:hypothetical protein [Tahibacter amnicola]|uniref:Uncharacterized protein n=1 Tax=Tahibacter amnicola TaxID=2976241 RepID=A0ABY6BJD8_9GAMM|nr:hypothetical protein [Tahibacter amnicola]UXI67947.1 hypothetical protein N4264_25005 [Tahibacter amnicola]
MADNDVSGSADRLAASQLAEQAARSSRQAIAEHGILNPWYAKPGYVRVAVLLVVLSLLLLMVMELALGGSARWGYAEGGLYFVGQKMGGHAREVSYWAWLASWAAEYLVGASMLFAVLARILYRLHRHI